jgi:hypothetical protein
MQLIQNAIGQLQDPFFYRNGIKTSGLYNAFTAEVFIRRMDAIRMRHHPMEDETAINRTAENLRDGAENWWLAICDTEPDRAPVQMQWEAFVERFKFSSCKETTQWDTTIAYLELKQKPEQPPNEYLHAVVRLYTRGSKALLAEHIKLFADNVTYTFSQQQSAALLHGMVDDQATQKQLIGEIICESIVSSLKGAANHRRGRDITKAMALNCKPDHVRQAIRLKAPQGLPPLELEKLIMLQVQSRDKNGAGNSSNSKKSTTAAGVSSTDATPEAHEEEDDAGISAASARGGPPSRGHRRGRRGRGQGSNNGNNGQSHGQQSLCSGPSSGAGRGQQCGRGPRGQGQQRQQQQQPPQQQQYLPPAYQRPFYPPPPHQEEYSRYDYPPQQYRAPNRPRFAGNGPARFAGNGPVALDPADQPADWPAYEEAPEEEFYANPIHRAPGNGWAA